MPFLTGNVTFTRFRVDGPKPRMFDESHLDRLRGHAAGQERIASADGIETGWAAGGHCLDTDFAIEKNVYPDHLLFDLRTDTDRPPPELLKAYYAVELKALSKDNPNGVPSGRQKREAKAAARDRLDQEATDGRFRKRQCVPAAWDAIKNEVLLGSTSTAAQDRFRSLFELTFGQALIPVTAGSLATAIDPRAADETLAGYVAGPDPDGCPCWQAGDGQPDFLGNEFLLWLWHFADAVGDTVLLPDGSDCVFMFSGGIKVEDPRGQTGDGTMNSTSAVRLPEARAAVRAGKLPRKAALTLVRHDDQFSLVLAAESFAVSKLKLPPPPEDVGGRAREEHRLQAVRDCVEAIDGLFAAFLADRIGSRWAEVHREIRGWLGAARMSGV